MKTAAKGPLEEMLKDSDRDNRMAAAEGLANIYGAAGDLEGITKLMKQQDTDIRVYAVKASVKLGKNAKLLLGDLLNIIHHHKSPQTWTQQSIPKAMYH